jgi:hypothetical protein
MLDIPSEIQCCGSETFHYGSGSDFSMSSGSGNNFQKVPVSETTFFLMKYDFKGPKLAFQNIILKEYLNLVHKNGQNYEIIPFLCVYIYFRIWTRIRIQNPRVTDPEKFRILADPDPVLDPQQCRNQSPI